MEGDVLTEVVEGLPSITFSNRAQEYIECQMAKTIIVKMLGERLDLIFQDKNDFNEALVGGPWIIFGSYLTVRPWSLDFSIAQVGLNCRVIGQTVGSVVKLNVHADYAHKGLFAQLAVCVNLRKPLASKRRKPPEEEIGNQLQDSVEMEVLVCYLERDPEMDDMANDSQTIEEVMVVEDACSDEFQKSRSEWLRNGDKNTSYFHSRTLTRRQFLSDITEIMGPLVCSFVRHSLGDSFQPSYGIRQGDPFSPYFFVLCMERLRHLIEEAIEKGSWKPLPILEEAEGEQE
ncbi:hypothetical protein J1N35_034373 [Gossypium stocksii]|uniref:DUF4283 domain-containing protein n=1 Tax=Gossypium stocksii TaxID=47602 RepID=A0A9D3US03_9ROSI|nr:hypothetical protein J1N35_034373 [Gossypium stocksii]